MITSLASVARQSQFTLVVRLGLVRGQERIEWDLRIDHHELASRQTHQYVRAQTSVGGGHCRLLGEVAVAEHAGHLDDVPELDLSPRSASRGTFERCCQVARLLR